VRDLLPQIEAKLEKFGARPHWGKLFAVDPAKLQARYPKLAEFKALLKQLDPSGKFRNQFLAGNLYSS
jgi:xylitol oxidase